MTSPTLLGVSGALRQGSTNSMLVREAARLFEPGAFVFADIRMPLYDGDLEAETGLPPEAQRLCDQILAADAIVISTPEYNANLPGVLKNALDWISRSKPAPMAGKPVAILSAAAGRAGGVRGQYSLRHCLTPFRPRVIQGMEVAIAGSGQAFDDAGRLRDDTGIALLQALMDELKSMV